jgi:hypothetical protein
VLGAAPEKCCTSTGVPAVGGAASTTEILETLPVVDTCWDVSDTAFSVVLGEVVLEVVWVKMGGGRT